jgi:hypothetical protein
MAYCPEVKLYLSLPALLKKKIDFREIEFINGDATLRIHKDKSNNLIQMISDIKMALERQSKNIQEQPLPYSFGRFTISQSQLKIIDQRLKPEPLHTSFIINAHGDIKGVIGKRKFPFILNALVVTPVNSISSSTVSPMKNPMEYVMNEINSRRPSQARIVKLNGSLGNISQINLEANNFPISIFNEHLPAIEKWEGHLAFNGELKKGLNGWNWGMTGSLSNPHPRAPGPWPNININFESNSNGKSGFLATIQDISNDATISGAVPFPDSHELDLSFQSSMLDVDQLLRYWETSHSTSIVAGSTNTISSIEEKKPWCVNLQAFVKNAHFRGENFTDLELIAHRFTNQDVSIETMTAHGLGGNLNATAEFRVDAQTVPVTETALLPNNFNLYWNIQNIDLSKLSAVLKFPPVLSGVGSSTGAVSGNIFALSSKKTKGQIHFNLSNGWVSGLPGLVKTITSLNIRSLFKKESEKNHEGLPYQTAQASIVLRDGQAIFEPAAVFNNETLQVAFLGTIDLDKQTVKGNLVIHFLTLVSEVISAIPGVRSLLIGDQKSIIPIWVEIRGPLKDPEIEVRQSKSFTEPVWNAVRRLFKLPINLFKGDSRP